MNSVQKRLAQDHSDIEALLERLMDGSTTSLPALQAMFNELEARLMSHMDAEEQYLLPLVEVSHPAEAEHTRSEHTRIRQMISELGLAVELHAARKTQLEELAAFLRQHAEREDSTLYLLAGDKASSAVEHRIAIIVKGAARSALEAARRIAAKPSEQVDEYRAHPC